MPFVDEFFQPQQPQSAFAFQPQQQHDWHTEFLASDIQHPVEFPAEFDAAFQPHQPVEWTDSFQSFQHVPEESPETMQQFNAAFDQALQITSWEQEFAPDWTEEFKQQNPMVIEGGIPETAAKLLDVVAHDTNPKFAQSNFLKFMRQLRDGNVAIEGNKVVEQIQPAGDWSQEFSKSDWTHEFQNKQQDWSQEFQNKQEQDWTGDFVQGSHLWDHGEPLHEWDNKGEQWAREFTQQEDWRAQYMRNIEPLTHEPSDAAWMAMHKAWETTPHATGLGYKTNDARYDFYAFQVSNPYLEVGVDTQAHVAHSPASIADTLLELEAVVQKDATHHQAWYLLALAHQKNDNDVAAIAALKNALKQERGMTLNEQLDALLALSVSFANENCRLDAMQVINVWIQGDPQYAAHAVTGQPADYGQAVVEALIACIRQSSHEPNAHLQVALGIALNMLGDHDKAIDCFKASLALRPDDGMLWNRLGAALANARQYEQAIEAYAHAIQLEPGFIRAHYNLGVAYMSLTNYHTASQHFLTALNIREPVQIISTSTGKDMLWEMLRVSMEMLGNTHLAQACQAHNLDAFKQEFTF